MGHRPLSLHCDPALPSIWPRDIELGALSSDAPSRGQLIQSIAPRLHRPRQQRAYTHSVILRATTIRHALPFSKASLLPPTSEFSESPYSSSIIEFSERLAIRRTWPLPFSTLVFLPIWARRGLLRHRLRVSRNILRRSIRPRNRNHYNPDGSYSHIKQ